MAHEHTHMDESHGRAAAAHAELEGEVLLQFVTDTAAWVQDLRGADASPVRRVMDVGSGPGVGTCELARRFPHAQVVAVDASPAMLDGVRRRAVELGLEARVNTHLAELPDGLDGLDPVDVIWASMSLHHVSDQVVALRTLHGLLEPGGVIAVAEVPEDAAPMRVLPDELDVGRPGLADRLDRAAAQWFAELRATLSNSGVSADVPTMLAAAGFAVIGSRLDRVQIEPPLADDARRLVLGYLSRAGKQLDELLDQDDLETLAILADPDDPRGAMHRFDVFVDASRQIAVAR